MLILTRFPGESLIINNNVYMTVLNLHRGRVSLGITAPKNIEVHREEIFRRLQIERAIPDNLDLEEHLDLIARINQNHRLHMLRSSM